MDASKKVLTNIKSKSKSALKNIKSRSRDAVKRFSRKKSKQNDDNDKTSKKNRIRFDAVEIVILQYILQLFMWMVINYNFISYYQQEADLRFKVKKSEQGWFKNPFSIPGEQIEYRAAPYVSLIKQSLMDAALTTSLKTIYKNLTNKKEKLAFIGMMIFLLYFLKRNEIETLGIPTFLADFDVARKGAEFGKMTRKMIPRFKGKPPPGSSRPHKHSSDDDGFSTADEDEEEMLDKRVQDFSKKNYFNLNPENKPPPSGQDTFFPEID
tara:strand:- start:1949 stop:2749 length:801 start_codon:yes stop_codon:yes gene_type:complete